ncbi:TPA: MutR family transcriptional regulator, partial [Enterococcus faecalis]|nr:MutR family transcriptional regulator [Enterococcus faecalis]
MHLNELMKIQRKSEKLSQAKFYEGIFQRNSASLFENHNEHFLKIADLPLLADR